MDIKLTYTALKNFVQTPIGAEEIASKVSLCGPTFDRIHSLNKNDYLFEIEAITNRVDTACALGVARETVATLHQFNLEAKLVNDPYQEKVKLTNLPSNIQKINIDNSKDIIRFCAITLKNVNITASSPETISLLESADQRSINNAVDITNEVTLLYGMPSHVFDLDKIPDQEITLRNSKPKERVITLDDTTNNLQGDDLVIENNQHKLIDLCGIMGGSLAEVDQNTKNILLIVPVYNPKKIRQTSLYLQKRTLAAQIYEKQPDPELAIYTLNYLVKLFADRTGATPASQIFDFYPNPYTGKYINLDLNWLTNFIGIKIESKQIISILDDLGFASKTENESSLLVQVPSFRQFDINIKEDLAEEISRIYGYFKFPSNLPTSILREPDQDPIFQLESNIKKYLADIGYSEVYNLSLISPKQIEQANLNPKELLELSNPLSQDYVYLRNNLFVSLIQNYKNNQTGQNSDINLFELSNTYLPNKQLPDEIPTLAVITNKSFFELKGDLEALLDVLAIKEIEFHQTNKNELSPIQNQSQTAIIKFKKQIVGTIGTINPKILNQFQIENTQPVSILEINLRHLICAQKPNPVYTPISNFPDKIEEITIQSSLTIGKLMNKISQQDNLIKKVEYLNSYHDNHTFRITLTSLTGNLTQETANKIKEKIQKKLI